MNISTTHVSMTLENMISFLKTLSIEVDSNFTQLKLLPRYAALGKMSALEPSSSSSVSVQNATSSISAANTTDAPVASMPASRPHEEPSTVLPSSSSSSSNHLKTAQTDYDERGPLMKSPIDGFVPTRRVRQPIGGCVRTHLLGACSLSYALTTVALRTFKRSLAETMTRLNRLSRP